MSTLVKIIFLTGVLVFSLNYKLSGDGERAEQQGTVRLKLGYSKVVFQEADPKDANAAFIVWAKVLQKDLLVRHNINTELTSVVYESLNSIEDALRKNDVDVLGLTAPEYFTLKDKYNLTPGLTGFIDDSIYSNYILVVRTDSGINDLSDLSQKNLVIPPARKNPFIDIWLTDLLASQKSTEKESFFRKIDVVEKETNAIYSVFFKKGDCSIVLKRTFDVVSSLNPQIQKSLKILAASPDLVIGLAAFKKDTDSSRVKSYLEVAKDAHKTPQGSNILKIFKSKKLVEINDMDLISTKQLIDSYNLIIKNKNKKMIR